MNIGFNYIRFNYIRLKKITGFTFSIQFLIKFLFLFNLFIFNIFNFNLFQSSAYAGFDQDKEFPNYFVEGITQTQINQAIHTILDRLALPYQNSEGKLVKGPFFKEMADKIEKTNPDVDIFVAGGVTRSLLGYLYKRIYSAKEKEPQKPASLLLDELIHKIEKKQEIVPLTVLGIGSDLDILVSSKNKDQDLNAIKHQLVDFINSAEKESRLRNEVNKLKYNITPIADVKDYDQQIERAFGQGGSTLDLLAFSLKTHTMRSPHQLPHLFDNFLKGECDYLPPQNPKEKATPKQTARGLRRYLELPFLKLTPQGEKQLESELEGMYQSLQAGHELSQDTLDQFEKMVRNGRFGGAKNRFYHSNSRIEVLARAISDHYGSKLNKSVLIPEFADLIDPRTRKIQEFKTIPLIPVHKFIEAYTVDGHFYHGTPSTSNLLPIIRNGFILSKNTSGSSIGQGTAAWGRGVYSSPFLDTAKGYAAPNGVVLELSLRTDRNPRILDWKEVSNLPEMAEISKEAAAKNEDLFEYLCHHYGIDIIIHHHVLIQNSAVIQLPKKLEDFIKLQLASVKTRGAITPPNPQTGLASITPELLLYSKLYRLGKTLGLPSLTSPFELPGLSKTNSAELEFDSVIELLNSFQKTNAFFEHQFDLQFKKLTPAVAGLLKTIEHHTNLKSHLQIVRELSQSKDPNLFKFLKFYTNERTKELDLTGDDDSVELIRLASKVPPYYGLVRQSLTKLLQAIPPEQFENSISPQLMTMLEASLETPEIGTPIIHWLSSALNHPKFKIPEKLLSLIKKRTDSPSHILCIKAHINSGTPIDEEDVNKINLSDLSLVQNDLFPLLRAHLDKFPDSSLIHILNHGQNLFGFSDIIPFIIQSKTDTFPKLLLINLAASLDTPTSEAAVKAVKSRSHDYTIAEIMELISSHRPQLRSLGVSLGKNRKGDFSKKQIEDLLESVSDPKTAKFGAKVMKENPDLWNFSDLLKYWRVHPPSVRDSAAVLIKARASTGLLQKEVDEFFKISLATGPYNNSDQQKEAIQEVVERNAEFMSADTIRKLSKSAYYDHLVVYPLRAQKANLEPDFIFKLIDDSHRLILNREPGKIIEEILVAHHSDLTIPQLSEMMNDFPESGKKILKNRILTLIHTPTSVVPYLTYYSSNIRETAEEFVEAQLDKLPFHELTDYLNSTNWSIHAKVSEKLIHSQTPEALSFLKQLILSDDLIKKALSDRWIKEIDPSLAKKLIIELAEESPKNQRGERIPKLIQLITQNKLKLTHDLDLIEFLVSSLPQRNDGTLLLLDISHTVKWSNLDPAVKEKKTAQWKSSTNQNLKLLLNYLGWEWEYSSKNAAHLAPHLAPAADAVNADAADATVAGAVNTVHSVADAVNAVAHIATTLQKEGSGACGEVQGVLKQ